MSITTGSKSPLSPSGNPSEPHVDRTHCTPVGGDLILEIKVGFADYFGESLTTMLELIDKAEAVI
jgi:hypothetical protein